ncbi:MAG: UbiX family flavin prenyltransferase [Pseudomonadota bacterium]
MEKKKLIIGIGGASGAIYGVRLLEVLRADAGVETHLVMTKTAGLNLRLETDHTGEDVQALADQTYKSGDLAAAISSGSFRTDGMIVAACSMRLLSAIVHSHTDDLVSRAADVCLKDRRRLVLMPREAPLHQGHCKLLYQAAQLGAIIAPPMPAFYNKPSTIDDLVNHTVGRVLDLVGVEAGLVDRWAGAAS